MITLLCSALWLAIVGAVAYVGASVVWHEMADIGDFEPDDEDVPEDPDRARDWQIADEMEVW